MPTVATHTVPRPTPWCVAREMEDRYLVYNVKTDEMHLIHPVGYYVYQL